MGYVINSDFSISKRPKKSAVTIRTGGLLFAGVLLLLAAFNPLLALLVFALYLAIRLARR